MVTKFNKKDKIERLDLTEAPDSYFQTSQQLMADGNKKSLSKLRARNDKIHSELMELASNNNSKLKTYKNGNRVWYVVEGTNISISLVNS